MYAVVVFKSSNEVELVPSNWLEHSKLGSVLWPPLRSAAASKAVKERLKPDPNTWKSYEIRVLCMCKSYEDGRQKLKTAEDTSDIQTGDDVPSGNARKRRRKQPPAWSSSESDSEVPVQKTSRSSAQKATLPSAPEVPNVPVTRSSTDVVDVDDDSTEISFHSSQTSSSGIHKSHISTGVTAKDMTILKALSEVQVALAALKDEVTSQRKVLSAMSGKMRTPEINSKLPQNVTLPLENEEDIEKIEQSLKDAEAMTAFVNHLQLIGGDTIKECVKRYMGEVLHHQLALTYNWAGKSGWKGDGGVVKKAFRGLKICAAVTQAVVKNPNIETTSKAVEREVMCWLRNAGDRYGGRKRRHLLKLQKEDVAHQSDD